MSLQIDFATKKLYEQEKEIETLQTQLSEARELLREQLEAWETPQDKDPALDVNDWIKRAKKVVEGE